MKMLYLDKKERLRGWLTPTRIAISGAVLLLVGLLPVWPDFVQGPFILSAAQRVVLHATVPGTVDNISVQEGQRVSAGAPLLRMRNLDLESQTAQAQADLHAATARATSAALRYADFGPAEQKRQQLFEENRLSADMLARLAVVSPISGVVVTPHISDLVGRPLDEGDLVMELADTSQMKADVYLPEFSMRDIPLRAPVRLLVRGQLAPLAGVLSSVSSRSALVAGGLVPKEELQGLNPARYYVGTVFLKNDGGLMEGMNGSAKVLVGRRSLIEFCFRFGRDLIQRKVW